MAQRIVTNASTLIFHKLNKDFKAGFSLLKTKTLSRCTTCVFQKNFHFICYGQEGRKVRNDSGLEFCFHNNRTYCTKFGDVSKETEANVGDKVLVYYGAYTSKLKGLKVFSLSTSVATILVQPLMYEKLITLSKPALATCFTVVGFFTFVTPFLIHLVAKRYITEIIYNPVEDSYVLKTMTFFMREKSVKFTIDDIVSIEKPQGFSSFTVKGEPVIVFIEGFFDKSHYCRMMGFDKPLDFKIDPDEEAEVMK